MGVDEPLHAECRTLNQDAQASDSVQHEEACEVMDRKYTAQLQQVTAILFSNFIKIICT